MALEYTIYESPPRSFKSLIQIPGRELVTGEIAVGATNAVSSDTAGATASFVILQPAENCRIAIAAAPVAVNTGTKTRKLKAGGEYAFGIKPGDKIAVIQE